MSIMLRGRSFHQHPPQLQTKVQTVGTSTLTILFSHIITFYLGRPAKELIMMISLAARRDKALKMKWQCFKSPSV